MLKENIYINFPSTFEEKEEVGISITQIPLEVINGVRAWKGLCGENLPSLRQRETFITEPFGQWYFPLQYVQGNLNKRFELQSSLIRTFFEQ